MPENSAAMLINRNVDAVRSAVERLAATRPWSVTDVDAVHTALLPHERRGFRRALVWIGAGTPVRAAYVAPLAEHVPELMGDLVNYLETSDDPVLVQGCPVTRAAGNDSPVAGGEAVAAREAFVRFFLVATNDAVTVATDLMEQVRAVSASWTERTRGVRAHSAQHRILALLADRPVLTVTYAQKHIRYGDSRGGERHYSRVAIGKAFAELERRGIVERVDLRDRGTVVFAAREIVDLLLLSERRLGSELLDMVAAPLSARARRRTPVLPERLRPR